MTRSEVFIFSPHFSYPFVARRREEPSLQGAARISRRAVPAELYENILSKGNPGRNEAGAGRSKSQQKGYEKCGLEPPHLSTAIAMPMPPPMQRLAMPR